MRPEVEALAKLGPLPAERAASVDFLQHHEKLYRSIRRPVTDEEARALVKLFGADDCFGLAASLMHLVETAPGWPLEDCLRGSDNLWVNELRGRASRGGLL